MELAANSIRLAIALQGSGDSRLRSAEIEFAPAVYHDGQVFDLKAFRTTVQGAMRTQLRGATSQAVLAVGGQSLLVRRVPMPKLKAAELRHMLETQGDQWIPFLREGAVFDFVVVNPNLNEHQQEVLLVAVPTRFVEYAAALLNAAGLKLAALDLDISPVYRAAVQTGRAPAGGAVAVLDLSREKPRLGFYQEGLIVAARTLESRPPRANAADGASSFRFGGDFTIEVRRTLELMMTPLPESIQLSGLALLDPLRDEEQRAELERELAGGLQERLAPEFRISSVSGDRLPAGMVQPLGLSLVPGGSPAAFHLLPRPSVRELRQRRLSLLLSMLMLLGLAAYGLFWFLQMPQLQSEQVAKQRQLASMQAQIAREKEIALEEEKVKALAPLLDKLDQYDPWSVVEPRLKGVLPPGVRLTSVTGALPALTIAGTAPKPDSVAELMNALDKSPYFLNPILSNSGTGEGQVTFSLTLTLARREVKPQ